MMAGGGPAEMPDWIREGVPEHIRLRVGDVTRITLPSASGGGYSWEVSAESVEAGGVMAHIELGPVAPPGDPPSSAQAPEVLVVRALEGGTVPIRLRLFRRWLPDEPLVDTVVHVHAE